MRSLSKEFSRVLKADSKGRWAFRVFMLFCILALLTPLLANHKPLYIYHNHTSYFPIFKDYTERDFGGTLSLPTDYKNDDFQRHILKEGVIIWPLIAHSHISFDARLLKAPQGPSKHHWLGVDERGRDMGARLLYALRFTLFFSLALTFLSSLIGVALGALQGYMGGVVDLCIQRLLEIWSSVPLLFLVMALASFMDLTTGSLLFVLTLFKWGGIVPIMRIVFLKARTLPYVTASRLLGNRHGFIMWRHILPNVIFFPLSRIPFLLTNAITILTTLEFFGVSLPDHMVSFGGILVQGAGYLHAPWILFSGLIPLSLLLISLVFFGEAFQKSFILNRSGEGF